MFKKIFSTFLFLGVLMSGIANAQESKLLSYDFWEQASVADVEQVIKEGADVNALGGLMMLTTPVRVEHDFTPLMFVSHNGYNPKMLEILIKNGADVNAKNNHGMTALMFASEAGISTEAIEILAKNGADMNAISDLGTALELAVTSNARIGDGSIEYVPTLKMVEILLKNGADPKVGKVMMLASLQDIATLEFLVKAGANANSSEALMQACRYSSDPEVIEFFIKHGTDVNAKDEEGKTALDYAKQNEKIYNTKIYWKMNELMYK